MLNKVMIIGRLGRDPELRYVSGGQPVTSLNVATDESYFDRDGNRVEKTEWHRITVWGKTAENCHNYLTKGSLVYVEGSLQTRKWQDQQGQDRYSTDIRAQRVLFLDRKGEHQISEMDEQGFESSATPRSGMQQGRQGQEKAARQRSANRRQQDNEDMGPAFPSEANQLDDAPFDNVPF